MVRLFTSLRDLSLYKRRGFVLLRRYSTAIPELKLDTFSQRSIPGLKSAKKLWWAKEVTPQLYVAGGLTERQIKYAQDGGFRSLISLSTESTGSFGGEALPSTEEVEIIAKVSGLNFEAALNKDEDFTTLRSIQKVGRCISQLEKPLLLYSRDPASVAFSTLAHLAFMTRSDPIFEPKVSSESLFKMSAMMGMDFTEEKYRRAVAEVTGEPIVTNPPKPNVYKNWLGYWLANPIYGNWFTAGQIRRGHLKELEATGFKSVINMRMGMTLNDKPSQETITLINVHDNQDTYDEKDNPFRQTKASLENLVLDKSKDKKYVSNTSDVNYETRNAEEYGDDVGYNEEIESEHFKESTLNYYHMPVDLFVTYNADVFRQYQDQLLKIGEAGPVLFHCAIGKRAGFIGVLAAALQYNKDLPWALKRIHELGFVVNDTKFNDVLDMYKEVLGQK